MLEMDSMEERLNFKVPVPHFSGGKRCDAPLEYFGACNQYPWAEKI